MFTVQNFFTQKCRNNALKKVYNRASTRKPYVFNSLTLNNHDWVAFGYEDRSTSTLKC